jgi:hypothetical protein
VYKNTFLHYCFILLLSIYLGVTFCRGILGRFQKNRLIVFSDSGSDSFSIGSKSEMYI